jgi:diguanylate cyclase (GGDEF)-like protein
MSCEAASAELERLDALWEGLNVSRDNKALVLARDGTIINLNQLAANLSGRPLHDMLGAGVGELLEIPSSECSAAIECRKTILKAASGEAIAVEVTRQTLGARIRNLEVYAIRDLRERHATAERLARQGELLLRHEGDLEAQNARFEMTVNNMAQGVCLFGPDQRVVIANRRYAEIYGLTAEQVQRGTALRQILEARAAIGVYGDVGARKMVEEGVQSFTERVSGVVRLPDGRIISVLRLPMADGSLLSTHEDITEREELNARLAEQHERLDAALENMLQGLAMFDAEQRLIVCNRRYRDMYGLTCDQVKPGTTVRQILQYRIDNGFYHVRDVESFLGSWTDKFGEVSTRIQELADGRIISVTRRSMANGGRLVTHEDITERQKLHARLEHQHKLLEAHEERLRLQNLQLDAALNNIVQGLAMFDAEQRLILCNRRYGEIYGLSAEQTRLGITLQEIIQHRIDNGLGSEKSAQDIVDAILRRRDGGNFGQFYNQLSDGRSVAVTVRRMANGGTVTTHHDITEQRRSEAKIAHMAVHDTLTGLPNRVLLNERLEQALTRVKRGEMVAAHILDLDHFKHVNDTLGHPAGDKLLRMVADRLRKVARETDTVARMGGDEFAIVQVAINAPAEGTSLAERLISIVSEPYDVDGHHVVIGVSVGIAVGPSDGLNPDEIMRNADLALYRAKSDGRGAFRFFEPEMDAQMQARRTLECDLRKALPANEFELYYQPVVDLATNEISGFEALVRWHHPERGMVAPGAFIPLAEETGLIVPLGEWAIRQACGTAAQWPGNLKIAVNLSPAQFRSPGLLNAIVGALATTGLGPDRLELEITETILLQDSEKTLATLSRLRELGVRVVMDDFGTGYSSLSYLQSFPFDKIKIDRSFVKDIADNPGSLNIVRAVAALAKGLGMSTTAEGVETAEQLDSIRAEGCTEMQGFLFSRPLPAGEVAKLLVNGHAMSRDVAA